MNERIQELAEQAEAHYRANVLGASMYKTPPNRLMKKFAELIQEDMYRKVIASILITDVVMEEKGQKPTSEDYISAINKDFGVEE